MPIVGAPMAGGPGTPALAAAVSNAGGLGFVAAGYISAEQFADDIAAARAATTGPIGVNLFVPQPSVADWVALDYYAEELEEVAEHYHVEVGYPQFGDDDDWEQKLEVVADLRPELVSFTFGAPSPDVMRRFGALGCCCTVTVTSAYEAGVAVAAGADSLVVQGPDAGGHRGTFAPDMEPGTESLHRAAGSHRPHPRRSAHRGRRVGHRRRRRRSAAPGSGRRADRHRVVAVRRSRHQLRAPLALNHPQFDTTVVTRAFSGRYARGLANDFTRMMDQIAPLGYPEVNQMTSPIREAAVEMEDPHGTNLWAGTGYREASARAGEATSSAASATSGSGDPTSDQQCRRVGERQRQVGGNPLDTAARRHASKVPWQEPDPTGRRLASRGRRARSHTAWSRWSARPSTCGHRGGHVRHAVEHRVVHARRSGRRGWSVASPRSSRPDRWRCPPRPRPASSARQANSTPKSALWRRATARRRSPGRRA